MPFRHKYDPILETIKKAAGMLNMTTVQVGEEQFAGSIIEYIRGSIQDADAAVAIASEENGNVYYEIGYAHCRQKPVLLLTSDPKTLKFDLRDHRAIVYDPDSPTDCLDELVRTLNASITETDDPNEFLQNAFYNSKRHPEQGLEIGFERIARTVAERVDLQEPVEIAMTKFIKPGRLLTIEVRD
jgi:hypothetical protein